MVIQSPVLRQVILGLSALSILSIAATHVFAQDAQQPSNGNIVVEVTNLQNTGKGQLLALLYQKVNRVEVNGVRYFKRVVLPVSARKMTVTFENIPFGDYAVAVMHDMNKDFKMATTWVGIPDEDLGVSNNVKGGPLGGPKWGSAKFSHRIAQTRITPIKMWQCYD